MTATKDKTPKSSTSGSTDQKATSENTQNFENLIKEQSWINNWQIDDRISGREVPPPPQESTTGPSPSNTGAYKSPYSKLRRSYRCPYAMDSRKNQSDDRTLGGDEEKAVVTRLTQPTIATISAAWDFDNQDATLARLKMADSNISLKFKTDTYRRIPLFKDVA